MSAEALRKKLAQNFARRAFLRAQTKTLTDRMAELQSEAEAIPAKLEALQDFNQFLQLRTFTYFESIVNQCLAAIFPKPMTLHIKAEVKRNQFEVSFELHQGDEVFNPLDEMEGGVLDVVSFGLRIAYIALKPVRRLLVLDEPFKWVGASNRVRLPALLEALSRDLGFQIIIVTHLQELIDDDTITLT